MACMQKPDSIRNNKDDIKKNKKDSDKLAKLLGYAVALGSVGVKIPQVVRLFRNKSVEQLSLSMYCIELTTQCVSVFYSMRKGFPISSYGENISFLLSNASILLAFSRYSINTTHRYIAKLFLLFPFVLASLSMKKIIILQNSAVPLYILSRLPQIYSNYDLKSTGELSLVTFIGCLCGSLVRIYTTFKQMNGDKMMLSAFLLSVLLNGTIVAQIIKYKR